MKKFVALFAPGSMRSAITGFDTDPYLYDSTFNGGIIEEDRFAATTVDPYLLGPHLAVAANGDIIAAGVVPAAYRASPPANNLGMVRYGAAAARLAWNAPTAAYVFHDNRCIDYPNTPGGNIGWVDDVKIQGGNICVLVDIGLPTSQRNVRVLIFTEGGTLAQDMPAFTTGLDEAGHRSCRIATTQSTAGRTTASSSRQRRMRHRPAAMPSR